jgi:hypothetical protein
VPTSRQRRPTGRACDLDGADDGEAGVALSHRMARPNPDPHPARTRTPTRSHTRSEPGSGPGGQILRGAGRVGERGAALGSVTYQGEPRPVPRANQGPHVERTKGHT